MARPAPPGAAGRGRGVGARHDRRRPHAAARRDPGSCGWSASSWWCWSRPWPSTSTSRTSAASSLARQPRAAAQLPDRPVRGPDRLRRAVRRHVRAVRRRQHRHRGHDADGGLRRLAVGVGLAPVPRLDRRPSSASRRPSSRSSSRSSSAMLSRCSTPGCRSRSGPTRSSAARSSTSSPLGVTATEPAARLDVRLSGAGTLPRVRRPRRRSPRPPGRSAGSSTMFFNQGPIAMSPDRHRDRPPDPACSGRAGACGPARSASIRRRPRRSASTSSGLRYRNVLLGGVLAGLAGAYLSMEADNSFQAGMTGGAGSSAWRR